MIALLGGTGDWAKTVGGYNPSAGLTLRCDYTGTPPTTSWQKVEAQLGFGSFYWVAALECTWSYVNLPPPGHWQLYWKVTLVAKKPPGSPIWSGEDFGTITADVPNFFAVDFAATFTGAKGADRATVTPVRGVYGQHADEISFERRWYIDKDDMSTQASVGTLSKSYTTGTAYTVDEVTTGPVLPLGYDWTSGTDIGLGKFNDILIDGIAVPCDGLNELGGDTIGSGNDITCQNQDWSGSIYAPIHVLYKNLPAHILRWATAFPNARIIEALKRYQDGTDYILASAIEGYDSGRLWDLSWGDYPSWAASFLANRRVFFNVQAVSVQTGGANPDESDTDLIVPLLHYPLNDQDPAVGYINAVSYTHGGETTIEGVSIPTFRQSNWEFISGVNATIWNESTYTRFRVLAGGYANVKRDLVTEYFNDLDGSSTPWNLVWDLEPGVYTEDHCCWITLGAHLGIVGTFTWAAAEDRRFRIRIKHWVANGNPHIIVDTHNGDSDVQRDLDFVWSAQEEILDYYLTVTAADKGVNKTHQFDLDAPSGWTSEPELYHVSSIQFLDLIAGDDITYTEMKTIPDKRTVQGESARVQVSLPQSEAIEDKFGVAGFIGGHQCFQRVDDRVEQEGLQQGIAHCYPLYGVAGDISKLRELQDLVDIGNLLPGWTFTKNALGNALEDADGNVLLPEVVMLLRQDFTSGQYPAGEIPLFVQGGSIILPYGATYTARPYGIFGGAFHGLAWNSNHTIRASANQSVQVVRCSGGSPTATVEATGNTDLDGYYCAAPLAEDPTFAMKAGFDLTCHTAQNRVARWIASRTMPDGVHFLEHIENIVSLFYSNGGIKHVYNGPPDWYARFAINQANYTQPHQDTTGLDTSPTGYTDNHGFTRLFFIRSGTLYRAVSQNWGGTWATVATTVTGNRVSVTGLSIGTQIAILLNGTTLECHRSKDHFVTVDEETVVATGIDDAQPSVYVSGMTLYAAAFKSGLLTVWKSLNLGTTWTEMGDI